MKAKEKKTRALLEQLRMEIWETGGLEVIPDLYASDCVIRVDNETARGVKAVSEFDAAFAAAFPDLSYAWDETHVAGDGSSAVVRWHAEGTHLGAFRGIAQTGLAVSFWGISIYHFGDAGIAESWTTSTLPQVLEGLRKDSGEAS